MKNLIFLSIFSLFLLVSCGGNSQNNSNKNLNCVEYWSQVKFADFCGLTTSNFDFNTIPNDICNADQKNSFPFDDRISIRVFNHFSKDNAKEEYDDEKANSLSVTGYTAINNLGDDAFAILTTEFNKLDLAIIQVVKDTYTIYLEVNGDTANGSNNCFTEGSVIDFARALAGPL
ncbi:hypothetical protein QQ008_18115 [Fulvivirgaceae bacterium BMA10]|uniref:Uncharacterized protein n=1 Tax=Splendidivirga corallicola TaxID=3051826 RepID=A0ABT8KSB9_9BACT|nr:hypothetical protein [Fulvivirgaceae bacterium BMA10]